MKRPKRRWWKMGSILLLTGGCLVMSLTSSGADVGIVTWQQKYNPATSSWNNCFFYSVGFNSDHSVLVSGNRGEADSGSAIGIRYNTDTGAVLDTVPEWFLFEYGWGDYTQDSFMDLHIDSNGNIYFAGTGYKDNWNTFSSRYNIPNVWKYSSSYDNPVSGNPDRPLWRQFYAGAGTATQESGRFDAIALDSNDNVYAVGFYLNLSAAASNRDWIIDKFDSDGNRAAGFPLAHNVDNLNDYAADVAVDSDDNFIVVGSVLVDAATDHYDWVVRKYKSDGTLIWDTQYDFASGHDQALGVVIDTEDNIIVSGYRRNAAPADDNDWYVVKYAKDGDGQGGATVIWDQFWDDGNTEHGTAYGMALDKKDAFYLIGIQQKDSVSPAYTNRYRPLLQYRDGLTGALLGNQDIVLDATVNNRPDVEHDFLRQLALRDDRLVITGYTQQDGGYSVTRGRTGRVVMMSVGMIFSDGFE